jgi:uncharacterized RDD family membrane protein YckC
VTSQSPPPPSGGSYPPAPPSGTGYPPPPDAGFGQAPSFGGPITDASNYTPWFTRVLAYVIDTIPAYLLAAIGVVVLMTMQKIETVCIGEICATGKNGPSTAAWIIFSLGMLIAILFSLWNFVVRQGKTGSSIGKQMMKFKVVDEQTQQPTGVGKAFIRQLAHFVDAIICYVGFLFPLWDAKRQTIADKLMKTVCVPL